MTGKRFSLERTAGFCCHAAAISDILIVSPPVGAPMSSKVVSPGLFMRQGFPEMPKALGRHTGTWRSDIAVRAARPGLTLIEVLISVAIMATLMTLLLPAIGGTRAAARSFKCLSSQRSIAFDFTIFADDSLHGWRGNDESLGRHFRLETFQESQYRVDEFWGWGDEATHTMPDPSGNNIMRCSEVDGPITLRRNVTCSDGAVAPRANISFGFNIRLHAGERSVTVGNVSRVSVVRGIPLSLNVLDNNAPLVWDVDGPAADLKNANPIYTGPSLDSVTFARDAYWYPALRHAGRLNVGFIDGSVRTSAHPLDEPGWAWGFSAFR